MAKSLRQRMDSEGWPLCECCGGRKPAGCQTYDEVMGEFYNEQMAEWLESQNRPLPRVAPPGWDQDLWSEYRAGIMAERLSVARSWG